MIELGCVAGLFGVHAWVKIQSYAEPRENILNYEPWLLRQGAQPLQPMKIEASESHSKALVVKFVGCDDMDAARRLSGARIYVKREQLPALKPGQFYWTDLEGLNVETQDGVSLGKVAYLFATPANDVLVVKGDRERFIPYLLGQVVKNVDLSAKIMQVDWDPEF